MRSASFTPLGEGSRPAACTTRGLGGNNQVQQKKQDPQGTFALWWKTNSEDQFLDSVSKKVWDQFYHNYMVYHAYILGVLFNEKGIVDSKKEVYLPDEEEIYSFENKTLGTFIMIMSKEKGIMILFNTEEVSLEKRQHFLVQFSTTIKELIRNEIAPLRQEEYKKVWSSQKQIEYYELMKNTLSTSEEVTKIGERKLE